MPLVCSNVKILLQPLHWYFWRFWSLFFAKPLLTMLVELQFLQVIFCFGIILFFGFACFLLLYAWFYISYAPNITNVHAPDFTNGCASGFTWICEWNLAFFVFFWGFWWWVGVGVVILAWWDTRLHLDYWKSVVYL